MNSKTQVKNKPIGHIVFDHDGTLVNTDKYPFSLFTGTRELLVDLKTLNFEIYLWTARPRQSVLDSLKRLDIEFFFTDLFCYDDGLPKPNTMGLNKLTGGISKSEILHIGDSATDIEGAKAFGIEVVAACWNNPDQVNKYKDIADYTALTIAECREIIKRKFYV